MAAKTRRSIAMRDGTTTGRKSVTARAGAAASAGAAAPGRRERNKLDKLRRIKQATRDLFASKGFDDTTIREIAASAEVGLGTVFVYAANKRDLLFLIANEGLQEVEKRAQASVSGAASMLQNLLNVFRPHYAFFARQPGLSRLVLREMAFYGVGAQAGAFQRTRVALLDLIGEVVRLAIARKSIATAETPQLVGWAIFCIYQVELRRWLAQDKLVLRDGMDRLRRALTLLMTGLAPGKQALQVGAVTRRVTKGETAKAKRIGARARRQSG